VYRRRWPSRAAARGAICDYIEAFYNPRRIHSAVGNLSPVAYESHHSLVRQSA
jgi:transposase InsO family protein